MLSISPIKSGYGGGGGLAAYFEKEAAQLDYWATEAKENTRWLGQGAGRLGLKGAITQEAFVQVMDGKLPDGTQLTGNNRRLGYDLTFSAPKSVSIQALVGGDARILEAHQKAVDAAMQHMEARAAQTRIRFGQGEHDVTMQKTGNLTAAVFNHETSREMDPQLHSHVVVANATWDGEKWRALSSEEIFKMKMLGGAMYRATLAAELQKLGYGVEQTRLDGDFQIAGYTREQVEAFSIRRAQIEARLEELGVKGGRASARATMATRKRKEALSPEDRQNLTNAWKELAQDTGINFGIAKGESMVPNTEARALAAEASVRHALEALTERQTLVPALAVETKAMQRAVGVAQIEDVHDAIRKSVDAGEMVLTTKNGERFLTSQKALKREMQILASLDRSHGVVPQILATDDARLGKITQGLNAGQAIAAKMILTTTDRITGVQGFAGSGKTYMLARVAEEARAQGFEVHGLAPTASAAKTLGSEIGAEGKTLSAHLQRRAPTVEAKTPTKQLWVLDEAGLASTSQMRDLVLKAEREDAQLVLVGDTKQLAAVEAGAPFRQLQEHGMQTATMDQVMRHKNDQLSKVVGQIREGRGQEAVETMRKATGREGARLSWVEVDAAKGMKPEEAAQALREARLEASVNAYMESRQAGHDTLLVTERRADRADLNDMVRARLKEAGEIAQEGVEASVLHSKDLTKAEARLTHAYQPRDQVEFGRDYKSLDVQKGERLEVTGIDAERGRVLLAKADGTTIEWNPARQTRAQAYEVQKTELAKGDTINWTKNEYGMDRRNGELATVESVDAETNRATVQLADGKSQDLDLNESQHLDHGHAITIHKSQGRTTDHVIVSGDLSGQEAAYVAGSRARDAAEFISSGEKGPRFEQAGERLSKSIGESQPKDNALDDGWISAKVHTVEASHLESAAETGKNRAEQMAKVKEILGRGKLSEEQGQEAGHMEKKVTKEAPGVSALQQAEEILESLDQRAAKQKGKSLGIGM